MINYFALIAYTKTGIIAIIGILNHFIYNIKSYQDQILRKLQ